MLAPADLGPAKARLLGRRSAVLAAWAEKKKARWQSDAVRRQATPPLVEAAAAGAKLWHQVSSMS